MIVDAFLFHNEFDMLRCRGYELEGLVDLHVAIEGNRHHSGRPREYRLRGDEIANLEVIRVDLTDISDTPRNYSDAWRRDWKQRKAVEPLVADLADDTVIVYGDVDEIPRRATVESFDAPTVGLLRQECLIYSTRWKGPIWWRGATIGRKGAYTDGVPETRWSRGSFPDVDDGGWHLSWFGGRDVVLQKAQDFSHTDLAEDLARLGKQFDDRVWPGRDVPLTRYEGDLPRYVEDGLAPKAWREL